MYLVSDGLPYAQGTENLKLKNNKTLFTVSVQCKSDI